MSITREIVGVPRIYLSSGSCYFVVKYQRGSKKRYYGEFPKSALSFDSRALSYVENFWWIAFHRTEKILTAKKDKR